MTTYLVNVTGPVPLVLDLLIPHDRFGSSSDPSLNGHLHYPDDIDKSLNETALIIITILRDQSPLCLLFLVRLGGYIVNSLDCYSYRLIGKLTTFLKLQEFSLCNPTVD